MVAIRATVALVVLWCACLTPAWAGQVFLQLEPPRLEAGQTGTLTVLMVDDRTRGAPQFEGPEGILLEFDGSYRQFRQDGFKRTDIHGFRYRITPMEAGEYTIGPLRLEMSGGKTLMSNAVVLKVQPRSAPGEAVDLVAESSFNTEEAWEGQTLVYSHSLTARLPVLGVQWRLPEFKGLTVPQSAEPAQSQYFIDDQDGQRITVNEGAVPLIASGTGDRSMEGAVVQARVAEGDGRTGLLGIRQYRTVTAASPATSLKVFPLPQAPPGFSGLVGEFQFNATLERRRAATGASVGYTLEVVGDGTIDGWSPPSLGEGLPISVYEDETAVQAGVRDGAFQALGRFEQVIVPLKAGQLNLPELEIVTFSPKRAEFVTHRVVLGALAVSAGSDQALDVESFSTARPEDVQAGAAVDFRGHFTWGPARTPALVPLVAAGTGVAALPALWVFLLSVVEAARRYAQARRQALERPPTPVERLRGLPETTEERLAALDAVLRQALAERVGTPVSELDRVQAVTLLPEPLAQQTLECSRALDRARFAAGETVDEDAVVAVIQALVSR